jgi:hypothetical protein
MFLGRAMVPALLLVVPAATRPVGHAPGTPKEEILLNLKDKVIRNLSSSGLTLAFQIAVTNRTSSNLNLVRYRYRVVINEKEYLNLTVALDSPISVPAGRDTLISLPVKISYPLLFEAVGPIEGKAFCDVVGEMSFADERRRADRVGFAFPGEFPIFKDPEVDLLPVKLRDLTVGGADLVFRARFRNLNGYELLIDRMSFRLEFGEKEVQAGLVPGDKSLPRSGEKIFDLPFTIDFFEAGKEVRELFQKPEIRCRFAGEIEIASAWGRLLIRFDKTQAVPVEKAP